MHALNDNIQQIFIRLECLHLNDDTDNALNGQEDDCRRTMLCDSSSSIPDNIVLHTLCHTLPLVPYGVLGLQTEQEAGGEVMNLLHTDSVWVPALLQVPCRE